MGTKTKKKSRRATIIAGILIGLLAIVAAVIGADFALNRGTIAPGTAIGGVDVGGLNRAEAQAKLELELGEKFSAPVTIKAGEITATIEPLRAGLGIDWDQTLLAVENQPFNPIRRFMGHWRTYEVPVVSSVDESLLNPELDRLVAELNREPINGAIRLEGGTVIVDPRPENGQVVQREWLATSIPAEWLSPQGVSVDASIVNPEYGVDKVQRVVDGIAAESVSAPIIVHGRDGIDGRIEPARMGEVVTFVAKNSTFIPEVNPELAREILSEGLAQTEVPKRNARIDFSNGSKVVTPHADGVMIDWEETLKELPQRITGTSPKEFDAIYRDNPATFTTEMAQVATFDQQVSSFTTSGYSGPSGVNIKRVAEMVSGAIVAPGEIFSLNGYTGPRGRAQGYVESGVILNGRADTAVGGGISQFATTLYNASYFAGMQDITHTPHSYYISRYPAGREATVYEGLIDLQFKNTSSHPVRIVTAFGDGAITVSFMGVKTVEVESVNGGRWAYTQPQVMNVSGSNCSPSGGAPGFTTSDTRIIRDLAGNELSREKQVTIYDPSPIVRCR
ncbi:VanW family protein [Corynebacterium sp. ES2794-CONJ1]|uniref:VanW family protein n=1 Tax=unclassified Corynebacterium TaxID=2624378 RepID=UPI002167CEEC|nr:MULTISPECIES: VanW family protein [unclassified Corynebacterium]MCS4490162.1 VanW family protein [Corynebacterium sp. ES2775-CONJ]MCS4492026.1 VanW family protein [Corynebacterium sp. ES2715-CONJ3]MCS4532131.1 VanW family protein [Corynebacterium sp. ES2730-CONJ]MCU9519533.1 VanW family protein [Corynebacterium sp. ES2794-CONJ1]